MTMTKEKAVPALIATDPLSTLEFSLIVSISEYQEELLYNFSHWNLYAFSLLKKKEDCKTDFSGYKCFLLLFYLW